MFVRAGSMDVDVEGIIQCIKQGDENGVQIQLQEFNKQVASQKSLPRTHSRVQVSSTNNKSFFCLTLQYAQCFFFDADERERRRVS